MSISASSDRIARVLGSVVGLLLTAGVVALCWPATLGGTTAYVLVSGDSMEPTMHSGDLAVLRRQPSYQRGDIVAFRVPRGEVGAGQVVIHRVVGGNADGYRLLGDNKAHEDPWQPAQGDVLGRRVLLVPRAGQAVQTIANPLGLGVMAGLLAAIVVAMPSSRKRGTSDAGEVRRLVEGAQGRASGPDADRAQRRHVEMRAPGDLVADP